MKLQKGASKDKQRLVAISKRKAYDEEKPKYEITLKEWTDKLNAGTKYT